MVALSAPMVSHLLFADDSLLFFQANKENALLIKAVLQLYCSTSGQRINMEKSSIHFAKGIRQQCCDIIKSELEIYNEALSEKYLCMLLMLGLLPMVPSNI